ncbi:MAG: UDP-3-O-(3-hydroxymyristoyl)glucosamine N-acyltransferase, partial [Candidatus Obscuribacterales bacterium]|nr:UDP-3-O-(3-hydroxymyristoyl)glucosamine N-acyltransferase [Candidatus Obscuribacterales bacterium]
ASIKIIPTGTKCDTPCIYVDRPLLAVQKVLTFFQGKRYYPDKGIHPTAIVDPSCEIAKDACIGPYVVIGPRTTVGKKTRILAGCVIGGQVEIGDECLLNAGSLVADHVKIRNRVILQQGAVIGSDGFAYVTEKESNLERRMKGNFNLSDEKNPHLKIPQIGTVILEDDVEIGSCATIDRATMGATVIGRGSKIDNQVMIAHNCKIGQEVLMVAQVAVAGSCNIGDRAILAGQTGIVDHLNIEKDVIIQGKSGVMKDISAGAVMQGYPATTAKEFMVSAAHIKKLPKIVSDIRSMRKEIDELRALIQKKTDLVGSGVES